MKKLIVIIFMVLTLISQGCTAQKTSMKNEIRIAEQFGIAYAPIQIMKHEQLLEKNVSGVSVVWEQMSNTAAIREAMVANKLDAGFMAIPPFLIGWDKGMDWKISTGLSSVPVGLVTVDEIESLGDITSNDRIALPQPGSVQHILLSMACEKEFNDPQKFDNQLVTLSHPDGMNALFSGKEIRAHFTSTPYLENELKNNGYHQILKGEDAFGTEFSFIVGVTTQKLHNDRPDLYEGFNKAVAEAIEYINKYPEESARILTDYYDLPEKEILEYITSEDTSYSSTVKGTKKFAQFMNQTEYLSKTYNHIDEILWKNVAYEE